MGPCDQVGHEPAALLAQGALVAALEELGYQRVRLYAGGIEDWVEVGLPIEKAA